MNNILVITGQYWPKPSANGACLDQILKGLFEEGYFSHVVSFTPLEDDYESEYCKTYSVPVFVRTATTRWYRKLQSGVNQLKCFPLQGAGIIEKAQLICERLIKEYQITTVLCVQKPASCGYLGVKLKNKNPELRTILYELDSLTDNISNYRSWTKYLRKRNNKLESLIYKNMDLILYLESHRRYYAQQRYDEFASKMKCVDIPLIDTETYNTSRQSDNSNPKKMIYSGVLTKGNRTPDYLLDILEAAGEKGLQAKMHFYSRGDCEDLLREKSNGSMKETVYAHGYVSKEELDKEVASSDVLVSIGEVFNGKVYSFPSKIIYYISMGKPILHIAPNRDDMCLSYLEKYPQALVLYQEHNLQENVDSLISFIETLDGSLVNFELIQDRFKRNTARYTVDEIMDYLNGIKKA